MLYLFMSQDATFTNKYLNEMVNRCYLSDTIDMRHE